MSQGFLAQYCNDVCSWRNYVCKFAWVPRAVLQRCVLMKKLCLQVRMGSSCSIATMCAHIETMSASSHGFLVQYCNEMCSWGNYVCKFAWVPRAVLQRCVLTRKLCLQVRIGSSRSIATMCAHEETMSASSHWFLAQYCNDVCSWRNYVCKFAWVPRAVLQRCVLMKKLSSQTKWNIRECFLRQA
jgi:hypothetical protein